MKAKKFTKKRRRWIPKPVRTNCPFCKEEREPDYQNTSELMKYLSDRAKILPKARTGLCRTHQRRMARGIKRARDAGLQNMR